MLAKKLTALIFTLGLMLCMFPVNISAQQEYTERVMSAEKLTEEKVYNIIIAMKEQYPQGKSWTNSDYYYSRYLGNGWGCAAFAFILSDAAFGTRPVNKINVSSQAELDMIRTGDILRVNNDRHSVVVLEKNGNTVRVAEGNYNSSINWGRIITLTPEYVNYIQTRYTAEDLKEDPTVTGISFSGETMTVSYSDGTSVTLSLTGADRELIDSFSLSQCIDYVNYFSRNGEEKSIILTEGQLWAIKRVLSESKTQAAGGRICLEPILAMIKF